MKTLLIVLSAVVCIVICRAWIKSRKRKRDEEFRIGSMRELSEGEHNGTEQ